MQNLEDRIREVIAQEVNISIGEIKPQVSFVNDLGIDSLDIIDIIMALEEEFNVEIPEEDVDQMVKVKDLVEYIAHRLKNSIKK